LPKRVLIVGLEPRVVDYTSPAMPPGVTAETVRQALTAEQARLKAVGVETELCLVDAGETAEAVLGQRLAAQAFDAVVIGAGIRAFPANFQLFERVINLVHALAPGAKIAFNTRPEDTTAAVQRWL